MTTYTLDGLPSDLLDSDVIGDRNLKTSITGTASMSPNQNELGTDAWGRNKTVADFSLFHGVFSYDVPNRMWIEGTDGVEIFPKVNATSYDGMLKIVSNGTNVGLRSKRHPRYQPNRGHLYSTSMIFPSPTADGIRDFGLFDNKNGAFFRLKSDGLYACRRTTTIAAGTVTTETLIPNISHIDLSKGNVFDIQMQWRGVGNFKYFINLQEVYNNEVLGTLTELSVSNPALPIAFGCQYGTEDVTMLCGCVDVTSEGGVNEKRQYNSVTTGMNVATVKADADANGTATLAIALPFQIDGKPYTRDVILSMVTTFTKDEATTGIWFFRYSTGTDSLSLFNHILTDQLANDSYVGYSVGGINSDLDSLFQAAVNEGQLLVSKRVEVDDANELDNPDKNNAEFLITGGDMIIVSVRPDGSGKNTGCSIEFSEEI